MAMEIVSFSLKHIVIFHSFVSLPEVKAPKAAVEMRELRCWRSVNCRNSIKDTASKTRKRGALGNLQEWWLIDAYSKTPSFTTVGSWITHPMMGRACSSWAQPREKAQRSTKIIRRHEKNIGGWWTRPVRGFRFEFQDLGVTSWKPGICGTL